MTLGGPRRPCHGDVAPSLPDPTPLDSGERSLSVGHPDSWAEIVDVARIPRRRRPRSTRESRVAGGFPPGPRPGRGPAPGPLSFGALRSIAHGVALRQGPLPSGDESHGG